MFLYSILVTQILIIGCLLNENNVYLSTCGKNQRGQITFHSKNKWPLENKIGLQIAPGLL